MHSSNAIKNSACAAEAIVNEGVLAICHSNFQPSKSNKEQQKSGKGMLFTASNTVSPIVKYVNFVSGF